MNGKYLLNYTIEIIWFHTKIIISLQSELYLPIFVPYLKNYWKLIIVEDHQNDKTDLFSKVFWRIKGSVTKSSYIIHSRFLTLLSAIVPFWRQMSYILNSGRELRLVMLISALFLTASYFQHRPFHKCFVLILNWIFMYLFTTENSELWHTH